MTEQEAIEKLKSLNGDPESSHGKADDILLQFLEDNGFKSVADEWDEAWRRIGFWYA